MDSKSCKTVDEIPVINASQSHGGVRRSRDTEVTSSNSVKRTKFDPIQLENQCRSGIDVNSPENNVYSAEACDHIATSPCLKHDLSLDLKLQAELRCVTETSMCSNDGYSRETSSSSEICLDSDEMDSSSTLKPLPAATSCRKPSPAAAINPTAAEIDEFFSVMETKEQKRFTDKYNYDIVNDVPMEGRYKWIPLKP